MSDVSDVSNVSNVSNAGLSCKRYVILAISKKNTAVTIAVTV